MLWSAGGEPPGVLGPDGGPRTAWWLPWPDGQPRDGADGLPEGTVTVLFTDLVGSTQLNQQLGDERARSVGPGCGTLGPRSDRDHQGVLIKGLGDGVMAAFSSARRAVVCAREIQQGMAERGACGRRPRLAMRIGLHTGEVINEDGDIHGETVIIAKRIEGLARRGGSSRRSPSTWCSGRARRARGSGRVRVEGHHPSVAPVRSAVPAAGRSRRAHRFAAHPLHREGRPARAVEPPHLSGRGRELGCW